MRDEQEILAFITDFCARSDLIRAAILTGSRADPRHAVDWLSDYDVELYVSDMRPFLSDDDWLKPFGSVMLRWPRRPQTTFSPDWLTRLVVFTDRTRIDFQITGLKKPRPEHYDNGYRVLIDKDGIAAGLPAPTYTGYNVTPPTETEYLDTVNAFWWDALYVPKALWRNELPFARYMLEVQLRFTFLHRVLGWKISGDGGWSVNPGLEGKYLQKYLSGDTWKQYEATCAAADASSAWTAFFTLVDLFSRLARETGDRLEFRYPENTEREARAFCRIIREETVKKGSTSQ